MPLLLILALLAAEAAPTAAPPRGSIEATIRGTAQPLEVELLLRDAGENWSEVAHQTLPPKDRRVRFDGLEAGVYQILVQGPVPTERLATKIAVGRTDARRTTITIDPFILKGRVTLGGTGMGMGGVLLRHREFHWKSVIPLADDGTFQAPLWQRGTFSYGVRGPALPTEYLDSGDIDGASPLHIDIPDGRISGVVRDKSGKPVANATVALQTNVEDREEHVRLTTGPEGRFDFVGIKPGSHTVRLTSPQYLEPEPIAFKLTAAAPLRELDIRLDSGRAVPIVVIDKEHDPVANAKVFVVSDSKLCARTTTDEDGRATVAVPSSDAATLFVIAEEGPFAMTRVPRTEDKRRLQVYLPSTTSSLLIRALTTEGKTMPPFQLLMRYNGELVPTEVADELSAVQGLQLATGPDSEAHLRNIPSGSYEFWPYRSEAEAESIVAAGATFLAPIQVSVRMGENKIAVKFASRGGRR